MDVSFLFVHSISGQPLAPRCSHGETLRRHQTKDAQEDAPAIERRSKFAQRRDRSTLSEYSLLELATPVFTSTPSSSDDDERFAQAYSLMENAKWEEAGDIIEEGIESCDRKDRLCELIANIYVNEENPLGIGWYMQACVLGSRNWVPYLCVSYAARAIGLDDLAWRCLNACDVLESGMKRIPSFETVIKDLVKHLRHSDRSQLLEAMKSFTDAMDPYLPAPGELPHGRSKREVFLHQNLEHDPEMAPLKQRRRLWNKKSSGLSEVAAIPEEFLKPYQCMNCGRTFSAEDLDDRYWSDCPACKEHGQVATKSLVTCPSCREMFRIPRGKQGKVRCPFCGQRVEIQKDS